MERKKHVPRGKVTANKPLDDVIIVGIDFGTTYSGVAWAYSRLPEDIEVVTSWEAELSKCSDLEKVPTQLLYDDDEIASWGYSIPGDEIGLKWFKLLLLEDSDITAEMSNSSQIREARKFLKETNDDAVGAVANFLRELWGHAMEAFIRKYGDELVGQSRIHVVVTLPAIWPPYAQQRMKRAAKMSGILDKRLCGETTLHFISEPEAAALATIQDLSQRPTIKKGDTLVICDAGGGTVDLISYVVESTNPFTVKECVKGDGGLCGSIFLDENFLKVIKSKVSSTSWGNVSKADEQEFLNHEWEHGIKEQFCGQDKSWLVSLPEGCHGVLNQGSKRQRRIQLSSNDVLSVFTPVVDKIEALVRRQTQAIRSKYGQPAKYVILVGGFGRSRYLYNRLRVSTGATVLQSSASKPWTAICRGAVVNGISHVLEPSLGVRIDSRIARCSYGVCFTDAFVPNRHRVRDKVWSEERQEWRADNQMKWFLREGNNVYTKRPIRSSYTRLFPDDDEDTGPIVQEIFSCPTSPPPRARGPTVGKLCEIHWTREVKLETLPTWTNSVGEVYRELEFEIKMTCEDGTVDFAVYFEGQRVGAQNIEVKF
ncbi:Heat shock 70 kDa protein 12B [Fusarium oxysporum f. sp. cubense]|uniref:Heat shock 70 kDa protein 12B n=1 Tax=Fusarium oxysporum f. sp. cubense TaxID=61366 RepID=A0A559LAT2_FUSOC|nr:Heat shock 70 kDa protein 12B [Fusarium oxysporum f. sp. cubense]